MKYFALCFAIITFFTGCGSIQNGEATTSKKLIQDSKIRLENSTEEQRRKLDQRIPPEVREVLDNAEEFVIFYNVDKKTMQLNVLMSETAPNANADISNSAVKKEFLDRFYADVATSSNGNACFSPRQRINAKYKTKVVKIDICYECGRFQGESPSGSFGGGLDDQTKSSAVIDAIIEKYGKKIK